jgi:hypothetical protein
MMVNIIIIIVIFASILSAVVYMSSSSLRQAVSSNQGANAWNMAEAGYRFLSINYLKTTDGTYLPANGTADDDKAYFLQSVVNGRTYVIPNNGSFTLTVQPYWFYNATATGTITNVSVQLPGTTPNNFTSMPATGQIKLLDSHGVEGLTSYTFGSFNSLTGVFTCTISPYPLSPSPPPPAPPYSGYSVYLVLNPKVNQALTQAPGNNTLTLDLNTFSASAAAFPAKDGLIEIGSTEFPSGETKLYRYSTAKAVGTVLTLYGLRHSDNSAFSIHVTTTPASTITFKKYLMAQSIGKVGSEQRTLSFSQAILDSFPPTSLVTTLGTAAELTGNFSRSSSIGGYEVANLQTSGGGYAYFSIIDSLATTGTGASAYNCGAFWYSNTSLINKVWAPPPVGSGIYLLSYDVQVKPATGNALTAGTIGLAIRAKMVTSTTEPDTYLALTFMKYDLANLYFTLDPLLFFTFTNGGTTAISSGNTVVGASSGATGVVQGTPVLTSGSWAGGDAAGIIIFASVTGTFSAGEGLMVGGVNRAKVSPLLFTNGGTTAINSGDTVVGASSHATGVVQGTPVLTSGSWAGGCAAGKIIFASVTGTFSAGEWLSVGGVNRAKVSSTINLFNPGDTLTGASSGAIGVVQGTPELTSGSWAAGKANGKIRFASVTGTFSANERLSVGGVPRVQVNGSNYFPAANPTDYIPQTIKPKPSDFETTLGTSSPFYCSRYNIGPLLLVLWERKADGTFRWLAFKDISNDDYTKGLQDWVEPNGSCTNPPSNCPGSDGQIIDDNASIYIRIQEKRVVLGAPPAVKVNDINLFYGDDSTRYIAPTWPARPGNTIPYDIKELRRLYIAGASPLVLTWVPDYIAQWDATVDYFSHIESGTPKGSQPQFQWDAVNPNVTDITVLKICDDGSAACTSAPNGTLRLTELVTPDSGTYNQPEIGMLACGKVTTSPYSTAGFAEFGFKTPGTTSGGFTDTTLYW